jgi:hypothetical protein
MVMVVMYQVVVVSLCLVFCVGEKVERGLIIIGGWAVRGLCKRQTDHFAPLVHMHQKKLSPPSHKPTNSSPTNIPLALVGFLSLPTIRTTPQSNNRVSPLPIQL